MFKIIREIKMMTLDVQGIPVEFELIYDYIPPQPQVVTPSREFNVDPSPAEFVLLSLNYHNMPVTNLLKNTDIHNHIVQLLQEEEPYD